MSFSLPEKKLLNTLNMPEKIQDYLNSIPFNFEKNGHDTIKSPLRTLRENNAHCFEGALLGAYLLSLHGHKPLIMALIASTTPVRGIKPDVDHCIAPFKVNGLWGALSKTNHAVLRYREPVYRSLRELVMSYFHEYFLNDGTKTLRSYSRPVNLNAISSNWFESVDDLWIVDEALDKTKHYQLLPNNYRRTLRKADSIERKAGMITDEHTAGAK